MSNPSATRLAILAILALLVVTSPGDGAENNVVGTWLTGDGDGWVDISVKDGTIYDPNSGKTYRCIITIVTEDRLKVRGYIGIALLGRTEIWTRKRKP